MTPPVPPTADQARIAGILAKPRNAWLLEILRTMKGGLALSQDDLRHLIERVQAADGLRDAAAYVIAVIHTSRQQANPDPAAVAIQLDEALDALSKCILACEVCARRDPPSQRVLVVPGLVK